MEVHASGRWYLALAVGMGVVSISSGNNLLYVFEAFLLAGLMVSGMISEQIVKNIEVEFSPGQAIAGAEVFDVWKINNTSRRPLFFVQVGLWSEGEFVSRALVSYLKPGQSVSVLSKQRFETRGQERWDRLCVATDFPFGFIRKMRPLGQAGSRWIWAKPQPFPVSMRSTEGSPRSTDEDDLNIYWSDQVATLRRQVFGKELLESSQEQGQWVREYQPLFGAIRFVLESSDLQNERRISGLAEQMARVGAQAREVVLVVKHPEGSREYLGERSAQDALAAL